MRKVLIAWSVLAAGAAAADVGSVINSFRMNAYSGTYRWCFGMARDEAYVYAVDFDLFTSEDYLIVRGPTGNLVRAVPVPGVGGSGRSFADNSHLGAGYMAVCDFGYLLTMDKKTGYTISSFGVNRADGFFWYGPYYYFARYRSPGVFDIYTSTGSSAGSWRASGWPAAITELSGCGYSPYACGAEGRYLVATAFESYEPSCIIDIGTGSLLATWALGASEGAVCGPAYPRTYGEAYWIIKIMTGSFYALQVDIGGRYVGVAPASVGKIKALYR